MDYKKMFDDVIKKHGIKMLFTVGTGLAIVFNELKANWDSYIIEN